MTKNVFVLLAAFALCSLQASFVRAADPDPDGVEKPCEQQQSRVQALENDRDQLTAEIYRLHDQIRRLNDTLNNIRRQIGDGEPAPTSR